MKFKRLYIHDDVAETVVTDDMISARHDDDLEYVVRGHSVGEINKTSNRFMSPKQEQAMSAATSVIRQIILQEFLKLDCFEPWRGREQFIRIGMASGCIFVIIDRPTSKPIGLKNRDMEEWPNLINAAQDIFEVRNAYVSSGGPDGGVIQLGYRLLATEIPVEFEETENETHNDSRKA